MSTTGSGGIPPERFAAMQEVADKAAGGVRDPESMWQALEALYRLRAEIGSRLGLLDIAVPAIRGLRDR